MMRFSLVVLFSLFSSLVWADTVEKRFTPLSSQNMFETVGGLLFVLLLILGGAWLFRRYGQLPIAGKNLINVLGGVSVGPRERVVVLSIDETRLVVGVAPGQVRTLYVLNSEERQNDCFQSQLQVAKKQNEEGD